MTEAEAAAARRAQTRREEAERYKTGVTAAVDHARSEVAIAAKKGARPGLAKAARRAGWIGPLLDAHGLAEADDKGLALAKIAGAGVGGALGGRLAGSGGAAVGAYVGEGLGSGLYRLRTELRPSLTNAVLRGWGSPEADLRVRHILAGGRR